MITVRMVKSFDELARLRDEWDGLLARSTDDEPMASWTWMTSWWQRFGASDGRSLRVAMLREGSRLVGILPLTRRIAWHRPGLPFRRLETLGTGEAEIDEVCSEYVGPIIERGSEPAVAEAIAIALRTNVLGRWDELALPAMNGDRTLPVLLRDALERHGLVATIDVAGIAPYVALPNTWSAYLDALGSSRRSLVRRSLRDFEAWAGAPLVVHRATDTASLARGRLALERLHAERWSKAGQGGVFASERFAGFHDVVMRGFLDRGALDLAWLEVRGEPVAASYSFVWNRRVYFYQGGRRVDLPKRLRPGIVMHALAIQSAIARGDIEYDFLRGNTRYKLELATATRPLLVVRASRNSLRELARRTVEGVTDQLRAIRAARRARVHRGILEVEPEGQYASEGNASTDSKKAEAVSPSTDMR